MMSKNKVLVLVMALAFILGYFVYVKLDNVRKIRQLRKILPRGNVTVKIDTLASDRACITLPNNYKVDVKIVKISQPGKAK
ncbi:MAG: hypothetical protein WC637_11665 [Victivallales bacterium]